MAKLAPPWIIFARQVEKLFELDEGVKVEYDDGSKTVTLHVVGTAKADALQKLLGTEKEFGNIVVTIEVVPANPERTRSDLIVDAFAGNPAFCCIEKSQDIGFDAAYAVMAPEAVQYVSDSLGSAYGVNTITYEDLAKEVIGNGEGVYFCSELIDDWIV